MSIRTWYAGLPVSVKLLSPPLIIFLSLWTAGTLGFGYFARNNLEQTARQETENLAILLQQDLQQKQKLLSLKTRWISEEQALIAAVSAGDPAALLRSVLPSQAALELDLIRVIDPEGQSLVVSQQRSLEGVILPDTTLNSAAQAGLEWSSILPSKNADPSSLISFISIKSSTQVLATLITGVAIDDMLLQQIRGNTSMHLIALQGDRVTASTLSLVGNQSWQVPLPDAISTRIKIAGEPYLIKTVELPSLDQSGFRIAVLKSIKDTEQAERQLWFVVGGFGLLGAILVAGVTIAGLRVTQVLSRRIQNLTRATQQLAQGHLSLRIPVDTQDEVGLLAQGFNTMAEQLTARDQQLNQQMQQLETALEDLHRTQSQMVQNEKMSALGQMVAGVAHEINNPVNFIHGNLTHLDHYMQDLLRLLESYRHHYPQPPQPLQADLEQTDLQFLTQDLTKILRSMQVGSDRIRDIVISLRNFSRLDEAEFKLADLHEGIDSTLMILQHRLKGGLGSAIVVVKDYSQLPLVKCYPGHLNQVFMNLLSNAIDAVEEAMCQHQSDQQQSDPQQIQPRTIWISTQVVEADAIEQVRIVIADSGGGISETVQSQIFDPFFTTKPVGKGTGLGLSITHQIVTEKHQGKIWCDSVVGKGSKFVIEIPVG